MAYKGCETNQVRDFLTYVSIYYLGSRTGRHDRYSDGTDAPKGQVWPCFRFFCKWLVSFCEEHKELPSGFILSEDGTALRIPRYSLPEILPGKADEKKKRAFFYREQPFAKRIRNLSKSRPLLDDEAGRESIGSLWEKEGPDFIKGRIPERFLRDLRGVAGSDICFAYQGDLLVGQSDALSYWLGVLPQDTAYPRKNRDEKPRDAAQRTAMILMTKFSREELLLITTAQQTDKQPDKFEDAETRRYVRESCFKSLRRQLCLPLRDADIVDLLPGRNLRAEEVPKLFQYVPHTLTLATMPPGQTAETAEWKSKDFEEVVELITKTDERLVLLVEAKAGYGKTTFMYHLAYELAKAEGGVLPLPPVRVVEEQRADKPVSWSGLVACGAHELAPLVPDVGGDALRDAVQSMLLNGRAVAFVDGLDQMTDGPGRLLKGLPSGSHPLKVVASCRQEVHASANEGWTHVLRLDSPSQEAFSKHVDDEHERLLRACLGGDDPRNPFMLHMVRVLAFGDGLAPQDVGITELFDSYLAFLFAWAKAKQTGTIITERPDQLSREQRLALGVLGLTSLRFRPQGDVTEQRIDKAVVDVARDLAMELAEQSHWTSRAVAKVDEVFDFSQAEADLVYIAREAFRSRHKTFLFHHQLLQEYLAAQGTVDELDRKMNGVAEDEKVNAALVFVSRIFGDVIRPCLLEKRESTVTEANAIEKRIYGLRYFEFVARLLGKKINLLTPKDRATLLSMIPEVILKNELAGSLLDPLEATALLRLRDEMVEHDAGLAAFALKKQKSCSWAEMDDPCAEQFDNAGIPPDPFMVFTWKKEREAIAVQMQCAPTTANLVQSLDAEHGGEWAVIEKFFDLADGSPARWQVVARRSNEVESESWRLVPPGAYLAGGWGKHREVPVRLEEMVGCWIAEQPVTGGQFQRFVEAHDAGGEYNYSKPWWEPIFAQTDFDFRHLNNRTHDTSGSFTNRPVTMVRWYESAAYCRWLNLTRTGFVDGPYRLPTDAEWEKAARGLLGRRWPWGCKWLTELSCRPPRSPSERAATKDNPNVSPFGVCGLVGNSFDWCGPLAQYRSVDSHDLKYARYPIETNMDEPIETAATWKWILDNKPWLIRNHDEASTRGGVHIGPDGPKPCACRTSFDAKNAMSYSGFRCVRDVK